jgi:hypothetical protein
MYNESQQDCIVLAFTGRQIKIFCSLPDQTRPVLPVVESRVAEVISFSEVKALQQPVVEVRSGEEKIDASLSGCIADISQNAEIINKQLVELRDLVHEFAEYIRRSES